MIIIKVRRRKKKKRVIDTKKNIAALRVRKLSTLKLN
jgi:hypothetical protein